jgi:outer membrane protein OmpA-like peptidoglycan-associated protein
VAEDEKFGYDKDGNSLNPADIEKKKKKDDDLAGAPNMKKEEVEEYDMEDDVNALLGGEELSEEFKAKAKTIFEAAINSKVAEIRATIEEEHEARLAEEIAEEKEALQERVDSYLEYVSDEWMEENQLAIEHGLKTELTESFLSGMRSLFEENYVTIPDDKYDVLESMVEKLDDMETKLNEQIEKNIGLNKRLSESVADGILESVSDGLAATQKEKLASLVESVEFESETEYREKLETLKESYFPNKTSNAKTETLTEGEAAAPETYSGSMGAYLKTLSSFKQN